MQTDNIFMIINYNDAETTLKLLTNIRMYFCLSEIVIIDNGSQDDSVNILQQETNKKISLLLHPEVHPDSMFFVHQIP